MKKNFTFGSSLADLNAFERNLNLNANGEVSIGTDNYDFKIRKDENMKKELLETIDETVENICKWTNEEFKPMKTLTRDVMLHHDTNRQTNKQFERKLKNIYALSEVLQARASIEECERKEVTNESTN